MSIRYEELSDEKLIELARNKDDEAMELLIMKYGFIVKRHVRTMFLIGAENEDLMQEGTIGLFKAIRDYDADGAASFPTFATLCVKRQIDTAIRSYNRKKHSPLNSYVSIFSTSENEKAGFEGDIEDQSIASNPEEAVLIKEQHETMLNRIRQELSPFENKVVSLYLEGLSHSDIADRLDKSPKAIDNALQRIRSKLSK
ncbi:MAG: sigma-70 family RNA polymerase sigma factor [Lachnospiraceae bacterium]|nr:sigma-70 family RNA polymerase sigma factor [Lachnospiraceae bacterium]